MVILLLELGTHLILLVLLSFSIPIPTFTPPTLLVLFPLLVLPVAVT